MNEEDRGYLADHFDLWKEMPADLRAKMEPIVQVLIAEKNFEACGSLEEVTREMVTSRRPVMPSNWRRALASVTSCASSSAGSSFSSVTMMTTVIGCCCYYYHQKRDRDGHVMIPFVTIDDSRNVAVVDLSSTFHVCFVDGVP